MSTSIDDVVSIYENGDDCPPKMSVDELKEKIRNLDSDEWCTVLQKLNHFIHEITPGALLLSNDQLKIVKLAQVSLSTLDISSVAFTDKDCLAENIGNFILNCSDAKICKQLAELMVSWLKKDWLMASPSLYPLLSYYIKQIKKHKKVVDTKQLAALTEVAIYAVRLCEMEGEDLTHEICSIAVHPVILQNQDARKFSVKVLESATLRTFEELKKTLNTSDKKLAAPIGDVLHRCLNSFGNQERKMFFIENCLQQLAHCSLCVSDEGMSQILLESFTLINKKVKVTSKNCDDLYEIYAPFLLKMAEAPNSIVRGRAAQLLFSAFPLNSSNLSDADNEQLNRDQLNAFKRLLEDDVPNVRAKSIAGLCLMASTLAEVLPVGWLQETLGKDQLFVRLAYDISSPDVRLACVTGLGRMAENHVLWPVVEKLFESCKYLLHDKSLNVRVAFAKMASKVAKLHAFKPWKYFQSRADFLPRLAIDDVTVCRPLSSLLSEIYMPSDKDALSHLDTCLNLVNSNEVGARHFYRNAVPRLPFVRASSFLDVILRHLAIKSSRIHKKVFETTDGNTTMEQSLIHDETISSDSLGVQVEQLVKLTHVAASCWLSLLKELKAPHNANTNKDLIKTASAGLPRIFRLCEHFHLDASSVVLFASCLPWKMVPSIFQKTTGFLRRPVSDDENDGFQKTATVAIKALSNWAKLSELLHIIHESLREGLPALKKKLKGDELDETSTSKRRSTRKRVRFDKSKAANKENQDGSNAINDLEAHLGLLDLLLRNRSSVKQLKDKNIQMKEIFDELSHSLELISQNGRHQKTELNDIDHILLQCFDFYCRVGQFLNCDSSKKPAIADDSFFRDTAAWLRTNTGIYSGAQASPLSLFQEELSKLYLKALTTRMMLNAVPMTLDTSANNQSVNSGISPCDIFEIALDACAFIPRENRVRLAESVVTLVYASVTKLANANSMLNIEERREHMRVLLDYLTAIDSADEICNVAILSQAVDCFLLQALMSKKALKNQNQNQNEKSDEQQRITECFKHIFSILLKSLSWDDMPEPEEEVGNDKKKIISKDPHSSSYLFNAILSRFLPIVSRSIFHQHQQVLEELINQQESEKCKKAVLRWLAVVGFRQSDLSEGLQFNLKPNQEAETESIQSQQPPVMVEIEAN